MSGRSELLAWINGTFGLRLSKIEEVCVQQQQQLSLQCVHPPFFLY